jgi:hypothetical protein
MLKKQKIRVDLFLLVGKIVVGVLSFCWICHPEMYANCMQIKKGFISVTFIKP